MSPVVITLVAILGGLGIIIMWLVSTYNGLVRRRVDCDNGWAQIDVQLKRRYDLIPNLVETVKGYAKHESGTLEAVIKARSAAVNISSDAAHAAEKAGAENVLSQTLGKLMMLQESYPDLKANQNFSELQEELTSTENKLGFARQHFNDTVARYEQHRQAFPPNIIAGMFNFTKREYFELDNEAAKEAPKVSFS